MWVVINVIVIALILAGIWYGIRKYLARNKSATEQPVLNPFSKPNVPAVIRSKFFPDQLYVGKTSTLDSSIQYMLSNLLFAFPTDPLIVKEFKYFDIDDNQFEEIVFDKIGPKNYIGLFDEVEQNFYFLNRVMSTTVNPSDLPPMVSQEVIELEENGNTYAYEDMSGLIRVNVSSISGQHERLIRVYSREVTPDDNEYLITIMDNTTTIHYYLGFNISVNQLV